MDIFLFFTVDERPTWTCNSQGQICDRICTMFISPELLAAH